MDACCVTGGAPARLSDRANLTKPNATHKPAGGLALERRAATPLYAVGYEDDGFLKFSTLAVND